MFSTIINGIARHTSQTKLILGELAEFRALKTEISKVRCVLEFDAQGIMTSVNENASKAFNYQQSELVGQHHRTLVGKDADSAEYQEFWRNLAAGQSQTGSFKLQNKTGSVMWFQGYYAPVINTEGRLSKVVAYLTDSTSAKLDELTSRGEEAALNESFGVIECDLQGTVITANDIALKPLGYSLDEVKNKSITVLLSSDVAQSEDYKKMWEALAAGKMQVKQIKRIAKNGSEYWFQANYSPVKDASNQTIKVMVYSTCITAEKNRNADYEGQLAAISRIQAVVEFDLTGKILKANENFMKTIGYSEEEFVGQHHSMFVDATEKSSPEYAKLWEKLNSGKAQAGVYKRIAKGGKEIWMQANYNPILDLTGKPYKVVEYASDVTKYKMMDAENDGQLAAINKIQGVIEFDLTGKIIKVNANFAAVTGYSESEIVGNNHSMFVDSAYKNSSEYKDFWEKLSRGEADVGQYKRIGKGGKAVWLQASYNPIFDMNGKPFKVVKFATDITQEHNNAVALEIAVEETQTVIEGAKAGDLTSRVPLEGKTGAIASLCSGVNALMDKMTDVLMQIREAGETINTAAGEIATGNNDLSSRTEQQASSLQETSSSMEELASTVKQNAENAKQANQLAAAASGVAVKGGEVVNNVVTTMSAINQSSRKIEDIISVIDGIAFQTNILALNAAVEAARAGEQGRGFAVVAGEVRNLAQRSASAAKEIKELITDSVAKTTEGTKLVEHAGVTMQEIVTSVQRVTDIMGEISAASNEQSSGIDQVNNSITSMDEVTQQNAALVEEAAAAAESLVEQAVSLMETVSGFKLNGETQHHVSARVHRPQAAKPAARKVAAPSPAPRVMAKTGTDDAGWEEF